MIKKLSNTAKKWPILRFSAGYSFNITKKEDSLFFFWGAFSAIDASEEMLTVATKSNSVPNVTYHKWDAQTVGDNPDWRERFDKVICFFVLHWIPDQLEAIRSISKCLKPGGEALFITSKRHDGHLLLQAESFLKSQEKWSHYLKVLSVK